MLLNLHCMSADNILADVERCVKSSTLNMQGKKEVFIITREISVDREKKEWEIIKYRMVKESGSEH